MLVFSSRYPVLTVGKAYSRTRPDAGNGIRDERASTG
jgi:hypothetical protein